MPPTSIGLLRFNESIHSNYTRQNYHYHLRKFMEYTGIKSYDKMLEMNQRSIQLNLERYLIMLKSKTNPNSIPTMFLGLRHFFVMNRVSVDWDLIRKMYPQKTLQSGTRAWTKADIQKILLAAANMRDIALIRFLASTGARIGSIEHDLQIKHLSLMPNDCMAIKIYAETIDEYWAFLTPASSNSLRQYIEKRALDGEDIVEQTPLFRNLYQKSSVHNVRQLRWSGARSVVYRLVQKANLRRAKSGKRYDIQIDHGFRKYFNTVLKLNPTVNNNIAEKLMGHKNGLDGTYFRPDRDQCFWEFQKAVTDLEICPEAALGQ